MDSVTVEAGEKEGGGDVVMALIPDEHDSPWYVLVALLCASSKVLVPIKKVSLIINS